MKLFFKKENNILKLEDVTLDQADVWAIIKKFFKYLNSELFFEDEMEKAFEKQYSGMEAKNRSCFFDHQIWNEGQTEWTLNSLLIFLKDFKKRVDGGNNFGSTIDVFVFENGKMVEVSAGEDLFLHEVIEWLEAGGFKKLLGEIKLLTE